MSLAIIHTRAQTGVDAPLVTVEVHLSNGLPALAIVGLPEAAVKESKERVRAALLHANFEFPARRITINLAPADLPKEGGRYDLAIALGILVASGQLPPASCDRHEFIGELALTGELRGVRGILPAALAATDAGRALIVPAANAAEGALAEAATLHAAHHLLEVCAHLSGARELPPLIMPAIPARIVTEDLADVRGQHHARRALEIAAAGGHSLLMIGPPGTGKTMLASRLPGILPLMTDQEALETAAVASISGNGFEIRHWRERPFRAPHHTASGIALVGGGSSPRPGEISLAHNGVLFLDELPEFDRRVLEVLREPLESGRIMISRAARQCEFPARFQLVAAMNPCNCGYLGDSSGRCRCTAEQIQRYRARVSGPLLDRIDMHIEVPALPRSALRQATNESTPTSAQVRERVIQARQRQLARDGKPAHQLAPREIERSCAIDASMAALLERAATQLGLSARAYHRILKVARTIADLDAEEQIGHAHLGEAIGYRTLDRRSTT
ncbi:MAG: YifB family Mg chelatase-like AAA ATPase [Gammaproteobacteria bacterium]|nr:YifB family Mg chelatase-like AAA ATPase [Gammaproteobacteria bacterium]